MVEYPPASFRDELVRVLSEEPDILADLLREHFSLDVSCSHGDYYDSKKVTVSLRGNFQKSWEQPILKAYDTLPS